MFEASGALSVLQRLARLCAVLGGLLISAVAALTFASVVGRSAWGWSFIGDFELAAAAAGVGIALFLPMGHLRGGNIVVDAFTAWAHPATIAKLDRLGNLGLGLMTALLGGCTALGAFRAYQNHSASMLLGFPDWIVYAGMVPPMGLTALIALMQSIQKGRSP